VVTDPGVVHIPNTYQHYAIVPASAVPALDVTKLPATGAAIEHSTSGDSFALTILLLMMFAACSLFGFGIALRRSVVEHGTTDC
jgi:hypothetical protein